MTEKRQNIKINLLDFIFIIAIMFSVSGYLLARAEKTQLNKVIKGKEQIAIQVYIPDVVSGGNNFFKINEKSAITIRNRPYTKLNIIDVNVEPKQIIIPSVPSSFKIVDDPTKSLIKSYIITLSDQAIKTDDGYVIGGNKIKVGNPIELEGFDYRLNGKIISVIKLEEFKKKKLETNIKRK